MSKGSGAGGAGSVNSAGRLTSQERAYQHAASRAASSLDSRPDDLKALIHYTGIGYEKVNELMRKGADDFAVKYGTAELKKNVRKR